MRAALFLSFIAVLVVACGPDATTLVGGEGADDDFETLGAELTSANGSGVWFPTANGNTWTYVNAAGSTRVVSNTEFSTGLGKVTGLFSQPVWMGSNSATSTTVLLWSEAKQDWLDFLKLGYSRTTWKMGSEPCTGFKVYRSATGTVVSTQAGAFSDTRTITFEQLPSTTAFCTPPAIAELTLVPNVGIVAFKTGRGERFTLKSAVLGGRAFPAAAGALTASVQLDKAAYVSTPNTVRCIRAPCPSNEVTASVKATFTLKNNTASAATWQFATGCQFDLEVVSASGVTLQKFSNTTVCTQATSSLTLAAGQSKTFSGDVTLLDRNGLQLDGNFTLRARLISRTGPVTPAAQAPFSVDVQEP